MFFGLVYVMGFPFICSTIHPFSVIGVPVGNNFASGSNAPMAPLILAFISVPLIPFCMREAAMLSVDHIRMSVLALLLLMLGSDLYLGWDVATSSANLLKDDALLKWLFSWVFWQVIVVFIGFAKIALEFRHLKANGGHKPPENSIQNLNP